jgi:ribosomal protein L40E
MRYCEAIEPALEAYGIASEASPGTATETLTQAPSSLALEQTFAQPTVAYVVGALVFGLAVGFGIAYAVTRRSKVEERPVKAQVAARPDLKWCYKCGARRAADSSFCEECGTSFT